MTQRRAIAGIKTRSPLRDDAEYLRALNELQVLGRAALSTPSTRGLQDLVDCILEYEAVRGGIPIGDWRAPGSDMDASNGTSGEESGGLA